jgi:hypothetical protein
VTPRSLGEASVTVPSDAQAGQTIVLIQQVSTTSSPAMTRYERIKLIVH